MIQRRLRHIPRPPHNARPKKTSEGKRVVSWNRAIERELARILATDHDGKRCSLSRGMISTKLQGR